MVTSDVNEIRRACDLICRDGEVRELRALGTIRGTVSGYFNNTAKLVAEAARAADELKAAGTYVTLNPVQDDLLFRSENTLTIRPKHATSDKETVARRWLPIDADPVRPAGISATEAEREQAWKRILAVRNFLTERGWPAPTIVADSGNGYHILYRVDLPANEGTTKLVKDVLATLAARFNDETVKLDSTVFNPARIWKVYGTAARKGSNAEPRPHRLARILEVNQ